MRLIEYSVTLTPDELHCLTCAMVGNFPERFASIRMDLLRKLAKAPHTNTPGAVEALQFYAQQYGVGARLASDGGSLARQTLRSMGVEPRAGGQ